MSYRSFTDILGETSLERKCRFLFGFCLLVLITGSFWWYGSLTEQLVYATTRSTGRHLVDAIMVQSHWNTWETNPQFSGMIESVGRDFQSEPYDWQVLDPRAGPEERHAEGYSRLDEAVLDYFEDHPPSGDVAAATAGEYREFRLPDQGKYYYYQTVRAKESCLRCHDVRPAPGVPTEGVPPVGVAVGDLMAVVRVVMPDGLTKKAINWNRAILLATAIMTVFLAMLAAYLIVRYVIVKPLEHLRDVSDEVRRGNVQARAEIHTADEFEELGVAFNRMLRGLVDTQEELQKVNESLDGKVDELARANLHLYEMNRMKSDFLATMSHELRTPLNSIIGFSDVLGSIQSLDDKQRRYVQNIRTSGRMLLDMINDILDLAKIEAGKTEIRPVTFDVESVVSAQCDMARPMAEKKAIDVTFEIGPGLEAVEQDQAKVQQILANLLSNAVKFTPGGGRVEVTAHLDDTTDPTRSEIVMDVIDSGVGIAAEEQQAIFEKFRQGKVFQKGDDAMTREISGTGLGLSIVRELCRLLGGDVTLESQLGRGSRFTIRLPARLQPVKPSAGATLALAD
ncbi:MAG: HAMP domain-containing protein [Planctomycetota bacterium]|jgi:signal transduction histidine kinase|nr:ATP-binding protein [Planctomycetota bacterium]RLS81742.1 MAG: HAMP domain-containing protein [Planctomycetota bacterium]